MPEAGNVWWFYSELAYPSGLLDLPPRPTKNVLQWIPFNTIDVVELEESHGRWLAERNENNTCSNNSIGSHSNQYSRPQSPITMNTPHHHHYNNNTIDELNCPARFVSVKRDTRQYLKVDLERMRMGPIYWHGEEHFIRR